MSDVPMCEGRRIVSFGDVRVVEPALVCELREVWERMRPEEREQGVRMNETWEDVWSFFETCRRTFAVWHRGELLGVATFSDLPDGHGFINFVRTESAMDPARHKLTWAKTIGRCARFVKDADLADGNDRPVYAVTPTDYARAIEFYCRHAHARRAGIIKLYGRDHQLLEICGKEK